MFMEETWGVGAQEAGGQRVKAAQRGPENLALKGGRCLSGRKGGMASIADGSEENKGRCLRRVTPEEVLRTSTLTSAFSGESPEAVWPQGSVSFPAQGSNPLLWEASLNGPQGRLRPGTRLSGPAG